MARKKNTLKPKSASGQTEQTGAKLSRYSPFPIVGVGASAGGLEAFTQLFKNLPADSGMAFVLIQHLAPAHESMLTELLSKATSMPVKEVKDGMTVEPDNVYVIPPDSEMVIFQGVLHLTPREKTRGQYMPVDSFLRSLAQDRGNNAIAVILSGSGSDGSNGIRVVKGEGGIVFAQDETAKYDGMPKSALDTGCADFVLPPDKIAAELLRIRSHPYLAPVRREESEQVIPAKENDLNRIFIMLRSVKGVDFTFYKRSTIMRRITRRMLLQKLEGMEEYVAYLKENPSEIETLYQDVLINVTSFFREPEAFEALKRSVFPHIVNKAAADAPVRIWVPACSTGEEAYSIAIALIEYMDDNKISRPVQLFATDIDDLAVEKARKGIYPENISRNVSPERLGRFFEKTAGGYVVNKFVREMCIFAKQNMVKDPPFSKIDLVSCRNVLIYFSQELQKKAIRILFYALSPKGFLMIGPSETVGEFAGLFSVVDKKHTIYAKKAEQPTLHVEQSSETPPLAPLLGKEGIGMVKLAPTLSDIQKEADTIVLTKYSPAGFVVNEAMKILQFRGDTGPYLRPAPGQASLDLLKMVSEDLVAELRTALHQAKKEGVPVRKERSRLKQDKRIKYINIDIVPFKAPATGERCFLVLFEDVGAGLKPAPAKKPARIAKGRQEDEEIVRLRQELAESKVHLNTVTQEHEAANEELQALNEELQSSNEEMQSINEEMETAREELQSTNEELTTVNDELQSRNEETMQLNNDLFNVLRGVDIPIIILGSGLQIRRFNDAAARILNLIPSDTGRPLSNIRTNIDIPDLEQMVLDSINTLAVKGKEVQDMKGRWYSMTIRPYKTVDNRIDGVLITLVDINDIKHNLLRVEQAYDYANDIVETVREPLLILDPGLKVITANRSFYENFLVDPEETEGRYIYELGAGQWNIPDLIKQLQEVLSENKSFSDFEVVQEFLHMGRKILRFNAREIRKEVFYHTPSSSLEKEYAGLILLAIEDITERKKIEDAQMFLVQSGWVASGEDFLKSLARYLAVNLGMDYVCIDRLQGEGLAAETVAVYFNGKFEDNVSYTLKDTPCGDVVGKTICSFPEGVRHLYPKDVILQEMLAESYVGTTLWSSGGQPIGLIALIGRKPISNVHLAEWMLSMVSVRAAGELERREAEQALQASSDRYRSYIEVTGALGWTTNAGGEVVEDLPSWRQYTGQTFEEVKGQGWAKALHPEDLAHTLQIWEKAVEGKSNYEVEYRIRRHDGLYRDFMTRGMPVFREDGSIREWIGTCIDITQRKESEETLKALNRELQVTSSELEAAYKDMESFSYSISHDLRAPLRIIDGLSDVVLKDYHDKLDDEGKNLLRLIQGNTKRMDQLVLALLEFSKAGRQEMNIDEINMEKAATLISADLKAMFPERNINVDIRELPPAHGDITLIRQVLTNLMSNAFKFTKDRDAAFIEVGGRREGGENYYYVKDNGAGFDMEYADKLFKVFQRLHSLKKFEGIGIGLSIVDRIIRRHGGRVWAEGRPDEGATFYFALPGKQE